MEVIERKKFRLNPVLRVSQEQREAESKLYYKAMAAMGVAMNLLGELEGTRFHKGKLKRVLNMAVKEMEEQERLFCNRQGITKNKLEAEAVWNQLNDSYTYFESWLDAAFDVPVESHEAFDKYIQIALKMYGKVKKV